LANAVRRTISAFARKKRKIKIKKIFKKKKKIKAFFQLYTIKIGGNKISPFSIFLFFVFKK
jgi:hypothetical protein